MAKRFLEVPRLRIWHLLVLVAAIAGYLAVFRFRDDTYTPLARELRDVRLGKVEARREAIRQLLSAEKVEPGVLAALLDALDDVDLEVRREATEGLCRVLTTTERTKPGEPRAPEARTRLAAQLGDDDAAIRLWSAKTLAALGDRSNRVRDVLIEMARQPGVKDRRAAIFELAADFDDEQAGSAVFAAMDDSDLWIRAVGVSALGIRVQRMKEIPEPVLQAVIGRLDDPAPQVRTAAAEMLANAREKAHLALAALVRRLNDTSIVARRAAVRALGALRCRGEPALPALREVAREDADTNIRAEAEATVRAVEQELKELRQSILPGLILELQDDDPARRLAAAQEVSGFGPSAREAVPALSNRLADTDPKVRRAAEAALQEIEPKPEDGHE